LIFFLNPKVGGSNPSGLATPVRATPCVILDAKRKSIQKVKKFVFNNERAFLEPDVTQS
jgi:hypothetical protein